MKLNNTTIIAALALGSLLALGSTVNAQDAAATNSATATVPAGPGRRQINVDQWVKILALTDEQKTNFTAVMQDMRKQLMAARNDASLSTQDRAAKTKALRTDMLAKMKDILTPAQLAKFQKMMSGNRRPAPAAPAAN